MNAAVRLPALLVSASLLGTTVGSTGCTSMPMTSMTTAAPLRSVPADFQMGRLSERTAFENDELSSGSTAPVAPNDGDGGSDPDADSQAARAQRTRRGLFLGGVIAAGVGGAGAIAFGAAGQITENRLDDGYGDGLTRSEESDFQDRGEAMNGVAIGSAVIALVGLSLTAIVLGVDYTRCGNLIKRRRKQCRKK